MRRKAKKPKGRAKPAVLIIDDEPDVCVLFQRLLEPEGYRVITAGDGPEGIEKNEQANPDLIILDLKMPQMDGIATLRRIRAKDEDVPVIILTGYGSAETAREAVDLDVYEYIAKPFRPADIIAAVKEALKK